MTRGSFRSVDAHTNEVFAYLRETQEQRVLVVLNFVSAPQHVDLSSVNKQGKVLCSIGMNRDSAVDLSQLTLQADEGLVLLV